jgi:hypothetical protein
MSLSPCGGGEVFSAHSERTNTSRFIFPRVISGSELLGIGFMRDEAVDLLHSAFDHTSSPITPRNGGPTFFMTVCCIAARATSRSALTSSSSRFFVLDIVSVGLCPDISVDCLTNERNNRRF